MDLLFAGLSCLTIAVINLFAINSTTAPASLVPLTQALLIIAGIYLIFAGFVKRLQAKRDLQISAPLSARNEVMRQSQIPDLLAKEEKVRTLQSSVAAHEKREAELNGRLQVEAQENRSLRQALEVANAAPKDSALAGTRSENLDAEIVSFLSVLQQKGRFIDFLMDDITPYSDAQVGAAARVVHQGCSTVMKEYFDLSPVQGDREGSAVTLESNYEPGRYRLVGKVVGTPPFKGVLVHRGWMATRVALPRLISETREAGWDVIAPAEIELR